MFFLHQIRLVCNQTLLIVFKVLYLVVLPFFILVVFVNLFLLACVRLLASKNYVFGFTFLFILSYLNIYYRQTLHLRIPFLIFRLMVVVAFSFSIIPFVKFVMFCCFIGAFIFMVVTKIAVLGINCFFIVIFFIVVIIIIIINFTVVNLVVIINFIMFMVLFVIIYLIFIRLV
jgi:hypothetical protein